MKAKITKRTVDLAAPMAADYWIWDTALKGFGLRVTPAGAKTYWVQYRMGGRGTPTRRLSIGRHGSPWTAEQARDRAAEVLAEVTRGVDPVAAAQARDAKRFTVAELADRYLEQHVEPKNKASTAKEFRRLVEKVIKPQLGALAVADVTRGDLSALHHRLGATPRSANHVLAVVSKMMHLAELWGFRPDGTNPCRLIERYKEATRERFLSDAEVETLGRVLAARQEARLDHAGVANAVRLLLLTGCRVGEVLALTWDDVDFEAGALVLRDAKAGGRRHPIGAVALAMLAEMHRPGPWVVSGRDPEKPLSQPTLSAAWNKIRSAAGLADVRLHDLRHTVGTYAGQAGANAFLVRDKLGHKTLAMTGRYVNRSADPLRELSDKIEGRISAALTAGAGRAADVVELRGRRKR